MYHQTGLLINGHKLHLIKFESQNRGMSQTTTVGLQTYFLQLNSVLRGNQIRSQQAATTGRMQFLPRVLISRAPAATKVMEAARPTNSMALRCFSEPTSCLNH